MDGTFFRIAGICRIEFDMGLAAWRIKPTLYPQNFKID
jgi:hypothetical protein